MGKIIALAQAKVTHILRPGKASEKTPKGVIPPSLCEISQNASRKKKTVSTSMMNDMYNFEIPHTVVTDQGSEFVSQKKNILFDSLNIDGKVTTGIHPKCNGAAE
jgi:hypothetical protein